jgi:hypothetical protein
MQWAHSSLQQQKSRCDKTRQQGGGETLGSATPGAQSTRAGARLLDALVGRRLVCIKNQALDRAALAVEVAEPAELRAFLLQLAEPRRDLLELQAAGAVVMCVTSF